MGRCRTAPLPDASAESLHAFVEDNVEPGSRVITDAWSGYLGLDSIGYVHKQRNQSAAAALGRNPGRLLPPVHGIASLIKRRRLGTDRGAVSRDQTSITADSLCNGLPQVQVAGA
jgi:hypothetical protein